MSSRNEAIRKHLTDMLAAEQHILEAVQRQAEDTETLQKHTDAGMLIRRIESVLRQHIDTLEHTADAYGAGLKADIKQTITGFLGVVAGMYDKVRTHELSRMLRDDYTALNLVAAAYGMMHTFGLTIEEPQIAALGLKGLEEITPLIFDINVVLPQVVMQEVAEQHGLEVNPAHRQLAVDNIQRAWQPSENPAF